MNYKGSGMERRKFARLSVNLDVTVISDHLPTATGRTISIGPGGMFVRMIPLGYSCDTEVEIEFSTSNGGGSERTYRIPATIVYATAKGLGLRFLESEESDYQISHTLLGLLCNNARPQASVAMHG